MLICLALISDMHVSFQAQSCTGKSPHAIQGGDTLLHLPLGSGERGSVRHRFEQFTRANRCELGQVLVNV